MKRMKKMIGLLLSAALVLPNTAAPLIAEAANYEGAYLVNEQFPEDQFYSSGEYKNQTNGIYISGNISWTARKISGLGGRAEDDFSVYGTADSQNQRKLALFPISFSNTADILTAEASFYVDEIEHVNVLFGTGWNATTANMDFAADGTVTIESGTHEVAATIPDAYKAGRWYKAVFSLNRTENNTYVYLNGELLATLDFVPDRVTRFEPIHNASDGSIKTFAFDDYKIYEAEYDPASDMVEDPEDITVPSGTSVEDIDGATRVIDAKGNAVTGAVQTGYKAVYESESGEVFKYAEITVDGETEPDPTETSEPEPTETADPSEPKTEVDATASDIGLTSSHVRVIVKEHEIVAISTPWHSSWQVSSNLLLSVLTSSEGWTLSYVDSNKAPASSNYVTGGYIKAEKPGKYAYIPIVTRTGMMSFDIHYDNNGGYYTGGNTEKEDIGGLGGKAADDLAYSLRVCSQVFSEWGCQEIDLTQALGNVWSYSVPFTVAFNAYADGDAVMRVNMGYRGSVASELFLWESDGTLKWRNVATGEDGEPTGTTSGITRGRWHRLAITWDPRQGTMENIQPTSGRLELYVDGQRLGSSLFVSDSTIVSKLLVGVDMDSTTGRVAFDDFTAWTGEYDGDLLGETLTLDAPEGITLNGSSIIVDPDMYSSVAALKNALAAAAGTDKINIYSDSSLSALASALETGVVAVIQLDSGVYHYLDVRVEGKDEFNTAYIRENFDNVKLKDLANAKLSMQLYEPGESCYSLNSMPEIGGKSDKALVISSAAGKTVADTSHSTPQIDLVDQSGFTDNIVAAECSICSVVDNPSKPNEGSVRIDLVQDKDWGKTLTVSLEPDGYIHVNNTRTDKQFTANQWYKAAFVLNRTEKTGKVYINGELIATVENFVYDRAATRFRASVGFDVSDGVSKNGTGAFDDYRIYMVDYDPTDDIIDVEFDSTVKYTADAERMVLPEGATKKDVIDALTTNAASVQIYEDDWYEDNYVLEDDDIVTEDNILVLRSVSGEVLKYIRKGEALPTEASDAVFTVSGSTITATTTVGAVGDPAMLIIAGKDSSGVLRHVAVTAITEADAYKNVSAAAEYNSDYTYTAYVWTKQLEALTDVNTYIAD